MANATQTETVETEMFAAGTVTITGLRVEYGIGRSTAYELMNTGRLPYSQPYGRRLIPRAAVRQLLADGMVGAGGARK